MLGIYRKKIIKIPKWCRRIIITSKINPIKIKIKLGKDGIEASGYGLSARSLTTHTGD